MDPTDETQTATPSLENVAQIHRTPSATTITIPSVSPSETTPSKPIPERATTPQPLNLEAPEWKNNGEALDWFVQLRERAKDVTYRYSSILQAAIGLFEDSHNTSYRDYKELKLHLESLWEGWRAFASSSTITTDFLTSSFLFGDFRSPISCMRTPKGASRRIAVRMSELRNNAREIVSGISALCSLVGEAAVRLEENRNGFETESFPKLPNIEGSSESEYSTTAPKNPLQSREGEDVYDEDEEETPEERAERERIEMGALRNVADMNLNAFDPVWMRSNGYPGEIPEEITDMMGETCSMQMIGPIRSIFWLAGYDDLVKVVDDPAYVLEDEIMAVPPGCRAGPFLLNLLYEEGKIPKELYWQHEYPQADINVRVMPVHVGIPRPVTDQIRPVALSELCQFVRPQNLPMSVQTLYMKHHKKRDVFCKQAKDHLGDDIMNNPSVSFRGLSLISLEQILAFFIPTARSASFDHEFGPGIYTTSDFPLAKAYAGSNGAIMVFKNTDYHNLEVWRPQGAEWNSLVAAWRRLPMKDIRLPDQYKTADVIVGPMSIEQDRRPEPDHNVIQQAHVSYRSFVNILVLLNLILGDQIIEVNELDEDEIVALLDVYTSTGPYEHSGGYAARRGHAPHLSDDSQHVTETIGYMYGDDYDKRDSKRLSYTPSSMTESLSVTSLHREKPPPPSNSNNYQRLLPIRTSSIDRSGTNGPGRQTLADPLSSDRDGTSQRSPVLTRSSSTATSKSIPLNDIDYESNPAAAVAQELSNLAALRRMSMDVGAADPDLPLIGSNFGVPPIPPSGESDDASQLFWVPARLHPGLAPKEFKSFLDGKAEQIKRRSGELTMTDSGLHVQGSTGGLRRKKSMLSRQVETPGFGGQKEGKQLDAVSEEASAGQGHGNDSMDDDIPILPAAPPGHSLRRSTRTTYRRGSFRSGDRIHYSRRAPRQSDPDAEAVARRSPQSGEEELPILGLTRVSTDPTHGGPLGFSRPTTRPKPSTTVNNLSSSSAESISDNIASGSRTASLPSSQPWPSWDLNDRPNSETPTTPQNLYKIIHKPPAESKELSATPTATVPNHIPARKSSHDPPPSQPPQSPLPPEPAGSRSSKRTGMIRPTKETPQTINDIASHPAALPGNSTRIDALSFIPTLTDTSNNKKSDSKKSKDKKDGEGGRKSSWTWLRGSDEKDKDRKREDESKKSKNRMPKIPEKPHDNTRLDLLQTSIDGAQKGRESIAIDRTEVRLEERRKDTAKRTPSSEPKKEKETSLFSSIFGGKKKGNLDSSQKKHSSNTLSPEPLPRKLKPDIDYNWTRFPISKEREIYRYAHWKLAEPKRALHSQVLLSNFMYSYLAKVQQMHPTLSMGPSAPQPQQRKREQSPAEDHSHQLRHQSREHDRYKNGSYYNESQYDYDGDDRDDQQWAQSGGRDHSQNGSAYGSDHQPQYGTSRSSFGDDAQLDDDDDMW
ncbi:hypothetical protein ACJ72_06040 [Emergomyces africanus]|uniref:Protein Zds1 C-terminal domain-containing protein n=1 Tax=Emergomyces africanus TaxID=1955775 RepID=A0A1B7NS71_9EURO|nr:hypothetical protein ACJ72_06040 [Emergomyces africanus]